jgi:hypothetical protein
MVVLFMQLHHIGCIMKGFRSVDPSVFKKVVSVLSRSLLWLAEPNAVLPLTKMIRKGGKAENRSSPYSEMMFPN